MTIWYTSDTHFSHENIIRYSGRPFKDAHEMDEELVKRWNEVVKPVDHIWHLGDLTMHRQIGQIAHSVLNRLNGHKRLILGNHDLDKVENYLKWFEKIKASHVHDNMLFTHIPVHPRSVGRFKAICHGHIHANPDYEPVTIFENKFVGHSTKEPVPRDVSYVNLSVEVTQYRPVSLEEINQRVKDGKWHWQKSK